MNLKMVGVCAHFGFGKELANGQTIKSKILLDAITELVGKENVQTVDTHGGIAAVGKMCKNTTDLFRDCRNIVILPAYKGLLLFAPMCAILNVFFKRKLFYVVIGGWLPKFVDEHIVVRKSLKHFDEIYVETKAMQVLMMEQGFSNVDVLPNCKEIPKVENADIAKKDDMAYKVCTFSRVMREKGIEIAIGAVQEANRQLGCILFYLDIYGPVLDSYKNEFEKVMKSVPSYICYKGSIPFEQSINTIKDYSALLFPTYYEGEGFAGTLIDAMAAGVPVIASDWKYNNEIVRNEMTGVLLPKCTVEQFTNQLIWISENKEKWLSMRYSCLEEAQKYDSKYIYQKLVAEMD